MNKKLLSSLLGLFIGLVISFGVNANYLSDWSSEDLCRWMDADTIPENILDEIYARKVVCYEKFKTSELKASTPYTNEKGTVFPSPKASITPKVKKNSGFKFRVNYKIVL